MATDSVMLFDERLCRKICEQDREGLVSLLYDRSTSLPQNGRQEQQQRHKQIPFGNDNKEATAEAKARAGWTW